MSHATDAAIGMMDGAYFTSRNEILQFLNTLLDLNLTKIEQTASGAVACQLTEYIFPGSIPMSRVNWQAKSSYEYVENYKLLQKAFTKHKIQRYVDVDKLIRGKYQDNLEFCQWLKAFFDQTAPMMRGGREDYDPIQQRNKGKGGKLVPSGGRSKGGGGGVTRKPVSGGASSSARSTASRSASGASSSSRTGTTASRPVRSSAATSTSSRVASSSKENNRPQPRKVTPTSSSSVSSAKVSAKYEEEIRKLKSENTTLKSKYNELERSATEAEMNLQTVEQERDFYFEKLRGIEVMLQVYKEKEEEVAGSGNVNGVMDSIFKVMYATMDDDIAVDDEGNLVGDITIESSIDKSALQSVKAQDDLGNQEEDDDELLTSGIEDTAVVENDDQVNASVEEDLVPSNSNQFASDSDDFDDEELLTSGLDDDVPAVAKVDDSVNKIDDTEFKECLVSDDYSDDDDELLTED